MTDREHIRPSFKIREFEGPMDLLFHLIEKNDIDIYDIPIAEITKQYLDFIQGMKELDMDVASEFLVMGATLVSIKSRMMLPKAKKIEGEEGDDPREELVISLLRYKRCRLFAEDLRKRREIYSGCALRLPTTAKELVFQIIRRRGKMLFDELFAGKKPEKIDKIVSFMAILELLRDNKINCEQEKPFDSILIEEKR